MLIDIEKVNEEIKNIEAKKSAIREAMRCGHDALDGKKPKTIKKIQSGSNCIEPITHSDGSYSGEFRISLGGHTLHEHTSEYSKSDVLYTRKNMLKLAAAIEKIFGPIPQELIDSVQVE